MTNRKELPLAWPPRLTAKEQQQLASNWLLSQELKQLATITEYSISARTLQRKVKDGVIWLHDSKYFITWLTLPETCYASKQLVSLSFRGLPTGYPSYVAIKLVDNPQTHLILE